MYINKLNIHLICMYMIICKYSLFIFIIYFYTWNSQPQTLSTNLWAHIDPIRLRGSWFHLYTPGSVDELRRCFCSHMLVVMRCISGWFLMLEGFCHAGKFQSFPVLTKVARPESCKFGLLSLPPKTSYWKHMQRV